MEDAGLWAGFALTLMIYSYLIRDNFLYRIAVYVFVGLAAGFIAIVTVESVLLPWYDLTVGAFLNEDGDAVNLGIGLIPALVLLLLLFKTSAPLARFGNLGIAFIVGVGTAVALVGALTGTLFPLMDGTINEVDNGAGNAVLLFIGVASSLLYFQYLARYTPDGRVDRPRALKAVAAIGQGFITIALGAMYAAAILTSLTIFSERLSFILGRF